MENWSGMAEEYYSPENDEISDSITQNWTVQALECYYLNCDCKKCSISKGNYSFICQMPRVIDTLLETVGAPEPERKTA
ncbi:hypothetical protein J6N69_00460 [bacterium]|nr:hypothetical protein [bacterium]MBP3846950.1 hypothetical protein [bacterium]